MSAEELAKMSLADLAEAYAGRRLSPVEVMETTLDHAQAVNPLINALFSFRPEQAIAGARQSEARWLPVSVPFMASRAIRGDLRGIPEGRRRARVRQSLRAQALCLSEPISPARF